MTTQSDDIKNKSFKSSLSGYKPGEVHAFLNELASIIDLLQKENADMRQQLLQAAEKKQYTEELDTKLQNLFNAMSDSTDRFTKHAELNIEAKLHQADLDRKIIIQNAKAEAAVIIHDAQSKSDRIISETEKKISQLKDDIANLRSSRQALTSRIKAIFQSQIDFLESLNMDFHEPFQPNESLLRMSPLHEGVGARELSNILQRLDELGEPE